MIFHFDCSVADLIACDKGKLDDVVSALTRAHRQGDHVVVIQRDICRFLTENADLSNKDRAILERIAFDYTQSGGLIHAAKNYIRIVVALPAEAAVARAINVDFNTFLASKISDRSVLLVENIRRDGLLYSELLKSHHDVMRCPYPAFIPMHGGGADLTAVFVEQINQKRIVCGIVDTDRSSPQVSVPKAEKLMRVASQMSWPFAFGIAPPCREAENCLPMELMMQLQSGRQNDHNCHYLAIADHERENACHPKNSFWLFVDLKEGVNLAAIAKIKDENERRWLEDKLRILPEAALTAGIVGYGPNVFDQLVAGGGNLAKLRAMTRTIAWKEIFSEFMEFLLWIFAGGRRIST